MAQYQITVNSELLQELFLLNGQDSGISKLLGSILNQILESQVAEQIGAERYERTEERKGYRNGSYIHHLTTRVGRLELNIPRLRDGKFSTEMFARYQWSEQALVIALMEMVINGVSTRKVSQITEELCGTAMSKSVISGLCQKLDPIVKGWNGRPIGEKKYPFLIIDALYLKVREEGRVRSRGLMVGIGVNEDGQREILGLMLGNSETEESWSEFFSSLKSRGLRGLDIVISDNHGGLVRAIRKHFQGVTWQRCQTHFMRNCLDSVPKQLKEEVYGKIRSILSASDKETARDLFNRFCETYADKLPKVVNLLENSFDEVTAVIDLPDKYRQRLRTTNSVERLNQEIRRRERVIRIFPNRESVIRLLGALLMEADEKWSSGKKYLDMDQYWDWRKSNSLQERSIVKLVQ